VYSQGVSSNVRGEHPLGGVDKTLNTNTDFNTNPYTILNPNPRAREPQNLTPDPYHNKPKSKCNWFGVNWRSLR